jgi:Domain of unknown function (DUF6851)/VCPO second helical-bundle domain
MPKWISLFLLLCITTPTGASVVSEWNEAALVEVRATRPGPPVVARMLAIAHTCMYDAWVPYDAKAKAVSSTIPRRPVAERTDANKAKALSFAAYRCLVNLFPSQASIDRLTAQMVTLGYDPAQTGGLATPQGIGTEAANRVIASRVDDGANQYGTLGPTGVPYSDYTGYVPRNAPMPFCLPTVPGCPPTFAVADPVHWQPLTSQDGFVQRFSQPQFGLVRPFALASGSALDYLIQTPTILTGPESATYAQDVQDILDASRELDLDAKVNVEYWADGPGVGPGQGSVFPAGHWGLFAQFVSQRDAHPIDEDVKMFFVMHNASMDAGIVAWNVKRQFDTVRPITAVRLLKQGQMISAWGGPNRPTELIRGETWSPYNPPLAPAFQSPGFAGYLSGHAIFSSASAYVLQRFTGSDFFGFSTVVPAGVGRVEPNIPPTDTVLSYTSFSDAADAAAASRIQAGIHWAQDCTEGQRLGTVVGQIAWQRARQYFAGTAP